MLSFNILKLGQAFRPGQRIVEPGLEPATVPEPNILKVQTSSVEPGINPEARAMASGLGNEFKRLDK